MPGETPIKEIRTIGVLPDANIRMVCLTGTPTASVGRAMIVRQPADAYFNCIARGFHVNSEWGYTGHRRSVAALVALCSFYVIFLVPLRYGKRRKSSDSVLRVVVASGGGLS